MEFEKLHYCSRLHLGQLFFTYVSYPLNFPHAPYLINDETRGGAELQLRGRSAILPLVYSSWAPD